MPRKKLSFQCGKSSINAYKKHGCSPVLFSWFHQSRTKKCRSCHLECRLSHLFATDIQTPHFFNNEKAGRAILQMFIPCRFSNDCQHLGRCCPFNAQIINKLIQQSTETSPCFFHPQSSPIPKNKRIPTTPMIAKVLRIT